MGWMRANMPKLKKVVVEKELGMPGQTIPEGIR